MKHALLPRRKPGRFITVGERLPLTPASKLAFVCADSVFVLVLPFILAPVYTQCVCVWLFNIILRPRVLRNKKMCLWSKVRGEPQWSGSGHVDRPQARGRRRAQSDREGRWRCRGRQSSGELLSTSLFYIVSSPVGDCLILLWWILVIILKIDVEEKLVI